MKGLADDGAGEGEEGISVLEGDDADLFLVDTKVEKVLADLFEGAVGTHGSLHKEKKCLDSVLETCLVDAVALRKGRDLCHQIRAVNQVSHQHVYELGQHLLWKGIQLLQIREELLVWLCWREVEAHHLSPLLSFVLSPSS